MKIGVLTRRTAAQAVLLAWAAALAWLARRELGKDEAQVIAEASIRLSPEAHFFAVKAGGQQIGYASVTIDTSATGFRLSEVMALDVPEGDSIRRVTRRTETALSRSLRVRRFTRTVTGGGFFEEFAGEMVGDTALRLSRRDGRDRPAEEWSLPVPGDVILASVLPYRLAFGKRLGVGQSVGANVLDLSTGTIDRVQFTATAESTFVVADSAVEQRGQSRWRAVTWDTLKAWRIEHTAMGTPVVTWVDGDGGVVVSEAALGVRLERSAFELVSFNYRSTLIKQGVAGHRGVPGMTTALEAAVTPDSGVAAEYRIAGTPVERFLLPRVAWLDGGRQRTAGDRIRLGAAPAADSTKSEFLAPASGGPPVAETVRARAITIAPRETEPEAVARALARWVADAIDPEPSPKAPVLAAHVLEAGRAGAEGKAALFVDLAKARGLGARLVGGALVTPERLLSHTWAEVWLDGGWVPVDPTFGRLPASAALVRVTVGAAGRPIDLVPLLGSARIVRVATVTQR